MTTSKQTMEGNRAIGKFVGITEEAPNVWVDIESGSIRILGEYRPHEDWNELMEAVKKIDEWFEENSDAYFGKIFGEDFPRITGLKIAESKKSVWLHVVQFANWYQQNISKNEAARKK